MKSFPLFLRTTGRSILIFGGGEKALQKCRLALKTDADIKVIAPTLVPELDVLFRAGRIDHKPIASVEDFSDTVIVFVATGCPGADIAYHSLAKANGIARSVVNVVDQPDLCDAFMPALVDRDPVVVAVGTDGTAPVLARQIKAKIDGMLESRLGEFAAMAGRLRVRARGLDPRHRRGFWEWVFAGPPRSAFRKGLESEAMRLMDGALRRGRAPKDSTGMVSIICVGSGGLDLMPLRAVQRLQDADHIYHDRLPDGSLLDVARRDAGRTIVEPTTHVKGLCRRRMAQEFLCALQDGRRVVRMVTDSPFALARACEELEEVQEKGLPWELISSGKTNDDRQSLSELYSAEAFISHKRANHCSVGRISEREPA